MGGEDWHFQFTEFPHSVTSWKNAGSPPPSVWKLPNEPEPPQPEPPTPEPEDVVTEEDIEKIAQRTTELVFQRMMSDLVTGKDQSFENMVRYTRSAIDKVDKQVEP